MNWFYKALSPYFTLVDNNSETVLEANEIRNLQKVLCIEICNFLLNNGIISCHDEAKGGEEGLCFKVSGNLLIDSVL